MFRDEFVESLDNRDIEYKLHSSDEEEINICCPFCLESGTTQDTRFRLGINVNGERAGCFNCGWRSRNGTMEKILRALGVDYVKRLDSVRREIRKKKKIKVQLPEDFQLIRVSGRRSYWHEFAYKYLKGRKLTDEQIIDRKIGFSMVGPLRYRIIIPVFYNGKLKGMVGRAFVKDLEPPYLNSIGEKVLYLAGGTGDGTTATLAEGSFDSLRIAEAAKKWPEVDNYSVLGTSLTTLQLKQLERYSRVISWFDPDDAGVKATNKLGRLWVGKKEYRFVPGSIGDPDPDKFSLEAIRRNLKNSLRWTDDKGLKLRLDMVPEE
jgi:hypothetical protein